MHHLELQNLTLAREVRAAKVQACEELLVHTFGNKDTIWEALEIGGNGKRCLPEGNKRIAIVGDRVLDLVLAEEWHARDERRYVYNRTTSSVCTNAYLAKICVHHGLEELTHSNVDPELALCDWMLATIVEAIIGAAYCDGSMPAARTVMTSLGLFGDEKDIMATSSLRGSAADLMILSTANNLNIWIPYRASG